MLDLIRSWSSSEGSCRALLLEGTLLFVFERVLNRISTGGGSALVVPDCLMET